MATVTVQDQEQNEGWCLLSSKYAKLDSRIQMTIWAINTLQKKSLVPVFETTYTDKKLITNLQH